MNKSTQKLIDRLDGVRSTGKDRWMATCPAHKDGSPSLSICDGDRCVLVHCFAGCDIDNVLAAINLSMADLFDGRQPERKHGSAPYLTAKELRTAIEDETWIVIVAAQAMLDKKFNPTDLERLHEVVPRLLRVVENTK